MSTSDSSDMRRAVERAGETVRNWPRFMQPSGAIPPNPDESPKPESAPADKPKERQAAD